MTAEPRAARPVPPGRRPTFVAAFVGLAAAAVGLIYGYDTGAMAGALLFVKTDFGLSTLDQEMVTAAVTVGSILGALAARRLCDQLGRRRTMVAVACGYAVFAAASGFAPTYPVLLVARFLLGVAVGVSIVAAPIFVGESAPVRIRGRLLVTYQLATTLGIASAYFTDLALSGAGAWRWMLGVSGIPAVLVTLLVARLPETPHWQVMRGNIEAAAAALRRTRSAEEAATELAEIRAALAAHDRGTFRDLFRRPFRRAGVFVVGLGFFVQITGIAAIVAYSPMIFKAVGFTSDRSAILVTSLVQLAAIIGEITALFLVERAGRRPTLITGISLMAAANVVLALVFGLGVGPGVPAAIAVLGVIVFRIGYSAGFGSLVWVYASEALPAPLRSTGASTLLAVDLLANFVITMTFLSALTALGGATTFGIFFVLCAAALAFVVRFAPETKGRPLEEIHRYWTNGARWDRPRTTVRG
ncbi:sugar porter family MFS transporter [Actinocatenispora rupis]|uniref:Putative sugar-transport integral membrane protein n=2 Tax=Actinocatenispora rupis TaxID=519421 RepID=A0A8J3J6M4_9ACTN|nr:putative sugar-transport integral membrane protein [Actinocatenispora rupis]